MGREEGALGTFAADGAVIDRDARAPADEFIISRLIRILKPPPTADVIHEDAVERRASAFDILDHSLEGRASLDVQTALAPSE